MSLSLWHILNRWYHIDASEGTTLCYSPWSIVNFQNSSAFYRPWCTIKQEFCNTIIFACNNSLIKPKYLYPPSTLHCYKIKQLSTESSNCSHVDYLIKIGWRADLLSFFFSYILDKGVFSHWKITYIPIIHSGNGEPTTINNFCS